MAILLCKQQIKSPPTKKTIIESPIFRRPAPFSRREHYKYLRPIRYCIYYKKVHLYFIYHPNSE